VLVLSDEERRMRFPGLCRSRPQSPGNGPVM